MNKIFAVFILLLSFQIMAKDKDCGGLKVCGIGDAQMCCAAAYRCENNQCVYDMNYKPRTQNAPSIPNYKPVAAKEIKVTEPVIESRGNYALPTNYSNEARKEQDKKSKLISKKDYESMPKGNYIRCYDGTIIEVKELMKASANQCKDRGGVYEYKIHQ